MQPAIVEIVNTFDDRELQLEAARVLASHDATNKFIRNFRSDHDSRQFYRNAIIWYIEKYGGFPSEVGPGLEVKLLYDN